MATQQLTPAQVSMLIDEKGVFTEHNTVGMSLKEKGLIDTKPLDIHRFEWDINHQGRQALVSHVTS